MQQLPCEVVPGLHQPRRMRNVRLFASSAEAVEALSQVTHEAMTTTDHLRCAVTLEAAHATDPPFAVLVIPLNGLLFGLRRQMDGVGQHLG